MDVFDQLLYELGKILDVDLYPDQNRCCLLVVNDEYRVQLEMDSYETNLLMASIIAEVPPGKFRENVLKDALKYNNLPTNLRIGSLGYIEKINSLSLFDYLYIHDLNASRIADHLGKFLDCLVLWNNALKSNLSSPPELLGEEQKKPSMFDVRP